VGLPILGCFLPNTANYRIPANTMLGWSMEAITKPLFAGIFASIILLMALWITIPFLLSIFGKHWLVLLPFITYVPPFVIGGYFAAKYTKSNYLSRYLIIGGVVGLVDSLIIFSIAKMEGDLSITVMIFISLISLSVIGSFFGYSKYHSKIFPNNKINKDA